MPVSLSLKTALVLAHVLGVAVGVGGVLMLDMYLLKFVRGAKIKARDVSTVSYVSLFVKAGLILVWASGILIIGSSPDGAAAEHEVAVAPQRGPLLPLRGALRGGRDVRQADASHQQGQQGQHHGHD